MAAIDRTRNQDLASTLLGEDVIHWLIARHAQGVGYPKLAEQLRDATNGVADFSHETIRQWLGRMSFSEAKARVEKKTP
jgi:hypothetical protein